MTLKAISKDRELSLRAERRHFIDPGKKDRHLNLLKEDLTLTADDAYKRRIVDPIPANPANVKSFYHAELEEKLSIIEKDVAAMKIGKVSKNDIDSILYVSTYQETFNPKKAANLHFVPAESLAVYKNTETKSSLYQESFGKDNSCQNKEVNKILNVDPHSFGKKNILYHQYTPGVKVEEVLVLDPNKTVYKTSYEKDYSQCKFIKDIPPEQIPIPSSLGSKNNKRNMKFRKWGGYLGA